MLTLKRPPVLRAGDHKRRTPAFPPADQQGLTLIELLVASSIGLVLTLAGLSMWQGNLRATTTLLRGSALRDNWSRVNLFMNADISEACGAAAAGGALTLRIKTNEFTTCDSATPGDVVTVTYQVVGANNTLQRTGPPVQSDGTLDLDGAPASFDLVNGATFDPTCTTNQEACYQLTLALGPSTYTGGIVAAGRARVREYQ